MSSNLDNLEGALRSFGESVIAEVRALSVSGGFHLKRQQYSVGPDFNLWYTLDPTLMNFEVETIEEDNWHWNDLESFLVEQAFAKPAYHHFGEDRSG